MHSSRIFRMRRRRILLLSPRQGNCELIAFRRLWKHILHLAKLHERTIEEKSPMLKFTRKPGLLQQQ